MTIPKTLLCTTAALAVLSFAASGCSGGSGDDDDDGGTSTPTPTVPTVVSNMPLANEPDAPRNGQISVTFSEPMNAATLTTSSFLVTQGVANTPVDGTVIYADSQVVFWPSVYLASNGSFTASVAATATSALGVPLAASHEWNFATTNSLAPGLPVNLRTAGDFVILAKTGISSVPNSVITGDIGVSPEAHTAITGFDPLANDASNTFSTCSQVIGRVYAANYTAPTPAKMTQAVSDMETAFTDAASRAPDVTELGAGEIGGLTLAPGVYKWGTGVLISTNLELSGPATGVWIFQIAQTLGIAPGVQVTLSGGALPKNIFWQVTDFVELNTTSHMEGVIITAKKVDMKTGATINGRILSQTRVDLDQNTVTKPAN